MLGVSCRETIYGICSDCKPSLVKWSLGRGVMRSSSLYPAVLRLAPTPASKGVGGFSGWIDA